MNECPECGAKILWGLADLERMEKVDVEPGDVVLAGCLLGEENHCPRCGALVLTAAEESFILMPVREGLFQML